MFEQPVSVQADYQQYAPVKLQHSGLGIASFIISIAAGIGMFILVAAAGIMETVMPGGVDEESAVAAVLGLLVIGSIMVQMGALALGISGLFQKDKYKVFAVLGVVFSSLSIFGIIGLIIIGIAMGA